MGRWYDRYCPRVGGLATSQGERTAQAMRADAAAVGLSSADAPAPPPPGPAREPGVRR